MAQMQSNIAVVGSGYWGKNLVRNIYELGALRTICDVNTKTINEFTKSYPEIQLTADFQSVLADNKIKGVVISTPAALHYSMVKEALEADKDIFVEKPLALTALEGQKLVGLAKSRGRILMTGHLLEYHPAIIKLKELIDKGELGKINYIYSNRLNLGKFRTEENVLWSFAPHDISVILLLLGEMPIEVSSYGESYISTGIEDTANINMKFSGSTKAHIFVSWLHPFKEQKLVVIGDKKMAVFNGTVTENQLVLYDYSIHWKGKTPVPEKKSSVNIEFSTDEPLKLECQHFIDCVSTHKKPKTDGDSAIRVLHVLEACQKSLEQEGKAMTLNSKDYFAHPTSIVEEPSSIGKGTKIWHFCHIMPNASIGANCTIGQNVFIGDGVKIGNRVKVENNVSIFSEVTLEDDVFCGPSCVFTNVINPRSHVCRKNEYQAILVKRSATIGANATIVCGHTIGRYAFVGAGTVVTRDVPDYALVYGNPARIKGWICECGEKLDFDDNGNAACLACKVKYQIRKDEKGQNILKIE